MAQDTNVCVVCGAPASREVRFDITSVVCERCGMYEIEIPGVGYKAKTRQETIRVSGWVRQQNDAGVHPVLTKEVAARVAAVRQPRYQERAQEVLKWLVAKQCVPGPKYNIAEHCHKQELFARSYSNDAADLGVLIHVLESQGYIELVPGHKLVRLTVDGLLKAEALSNAGGPSAQGFVAMDFASAMNDAWINGFDPGIRAAGYRPRRIDAKHYVGGITDEIMAEIRESRFVVADYTGQKAGVYFEAGFALGQGVQLLPTCRSDEIDKLHFDVRHLNTLPWDDPADLAKKLAERIRGVIGAGPDLSDA